MKPGTYEAKVMDFGINESRSGKIQAFAKFECEGLEGESNVVYWYGSLDETVRTSKQGKSYTMADITKRNLKTLGFKGTDVLEFTDPDAISMQENFKIVVDDFQTSDGARIPTVRKIESLDRPENNQVPDGPKKLSKLEAAAKLKNTGVAPKPIFNKPVAIGDIEF